VPLRGRGTVTPGSPNIMTTDLLDGQYWFTFHERSRRYGLDYAGTYIVMEPGAQSAMAATGMVLRWISSTDQQYHIGYASNLVAETRMIASNIPATPPMNAWTQAMSDANGVFFIQLAP